MPKKNNILSQIGDVFILYKLRWLIVIGIIFLGTIIFFVNKDLDKKYQEFGYTGIMDNIKYDDWTGEIILKDEIGTYNSDGKYITNSRKEKITVANIEKLLKEYEKIQGNYASFSKNKKKELDKICNILLKECLDLDYEIITSKENNLKRYYFKLKGEYKDSYYSEFTSASYLRGLVKEVFKDKYAKENNIN